MSVLFEKLKNNNNLQLLLRVVFIWACSRLFMLLMAGVFNIFMETDYSWSELINQWDAKRYYYIVENGYTFPNNFDPQANWAFFPVYVLACMALKFVTFGVLDTYLIGMIISNICTIVSAYYAVKCMGSSKRALLIPLMMMFGPYAFYSASMMTEAMFVMFIVLFFYFCQKKRFLAAGLMSALASGTRIVGCLLVFSLLMELYRHISPGKISAAGIKQFIITMLKTPKHIFSVLLCPFGAFCYMTFLNFFCGDAWAFKNVQIAWRDEHYFPVVGVLWKACTGQIEPRYTYMGWVCVLVLIIYAYMFYRKHYSLATFGLLSLLVALSSHVMSTCRFTVGSYVIYVGVYDLFTRCKDKYRWIKWSIFTILALAEVWLLLQWYNSSDWLF